VFIGFLGSREQGATIAYIRNSNIDTAKMSRPRRPGTDRCATFGRATIDEAHDLCPHARIGKIQREVLQEVLQYVLFWTPATADTTASVRTGSGRYQFDRFRLAADGTLLAENDAVVLLPPKCSGRCLYSSRMRKCRTEG